MRCSPSRAAAGAGAAGTKLLALLLVVLGASCAGCAAGPEQTESNGDALPGDAGPADGLGGDEGRTDAAAAPDSGRPDEVAADDDSGTGHAGDAGDGSLPCTPSGPELCNGRDDDCDGETDEEAAGGGAGCLLAGLPGELVCRGGALRCRNLPGPTVLCGAADGVLAPAPLPYRLTCSMTVPAGALLQAAEGVALQTGPHTLRVEGSIELGAVALSEAESVALDVAAAGQALLRGTSFIIHQGQGDPLIRLRGRAQATLLSVRLHDGLGRAIAVQTEGDAAPLVRDTTFAGFWVGLRAKEQSMPQVVDSRFLACGTGLMADGAARPAILGSRFSGPGFHLWLDPDALGRLGPSLPGLVFEGGTALVLSGSVDGDVRLARAGALEAVTLIGVQVAPRGLLRLGPGLRVDLHGQALTVAGRLELDRVSFPDLHAPALRFAPGSEGEIRGSIFQAGGIGHGQPLVEVLGSAPALTGSSFEDGRGEAIGIAVAGGGDAGMPHLAGNFFSGLWIGTEVEGPLATHLEGNRFQDCRTGVSVGAAAGTVVLDNGFIGEGVHLLLSPELFAPPGEGVGASMQVAHNFFEPPGTPVLVNGELLGEAELQAVQGQPLSLGALHVAAGARLTARATASGAQQVLLQGEGGLTVAGGLELQDVSIEQGRTTAVHFLARATGRLERVNVFHVGLGPAALIRVEDSSPVLLDLFLDGGRSSATGLLVAGSDAARPAAPLVRGCTFSDMLIAVSLQGEAAPILEENSYMGVALPLCPGSEGCP